MSSFFGNLPRKTTQRMRAARGNAREKQIREMPAAELEAFCAPNELVLERNRRIYFEEMDQVNLEMHATFDPWAECELARRNGTMPR